jgi:hypothetical protein
MSLARSPANLNLLWAYQIWQGRVLPVERCHDLKCCLLTRCCSITSDNSLFTEFLVQPFGMKVTRNKVLKLGPFLPPDSIHQSFLSARLSWLSSILAQPYQLQPHRGFLMVATGRILDFLLIHSCPGEEALQSFLLSHDSL